MSLKIGLVGATGMVGEVFLELLNEKNFSVSELRPFASEKSLGQKIQFRNQDWPLRTLEAGCFNGLDLVFFSSGDPISKEWAPQAVQSGAFAIDNSAAFRLDPEVPLIVPEVNGELCPKRAKPSIIANPNCSTIQLVVALQPLAKAFGLESVHVASYQAVSGAGKPARDELLQHTKEVLNGKSPESSEYFAHPMAFNCVPQIGSLDDKGFSSEENKIIKESKKILGLPDLRVSAFTVRVPVINAHSEAVWVRLKKIVQKEELLKALAQQQGLVLSETPENYPIPTEASGKNPVFVGRIHQDLDDPYTWIMWVVADNLRKGAALNGLQIAEGIFDIH